MKTLQDLRKEASSFRKSDKFKEAIYNFEKIFTDYKKEINEFDYWGYAASLRKFGNRQDSFNIAKEGIEKFPQDNFIKSIYAWTIYDLHIKSENTDTEKLLKWTNEIIKYSSQQDEKSPFVRCIFYLTDYFITKGQAKNALSWINKLNQEKLPTTDIYTIKDEEGRNKELASSKEKFYSKKTKILEKLEHFEECIRLCNEAVSNIKNLHYDNEVWFKYRIACCKIGLTKHDEALLLLREVYAHKKEWFIELQISIIYYYKEDFNKALNYSLKSILNFSEIDKKGEVLKLLSDIYTKLNNKQLTNKHLLLIYKIREENNWKISDELQKVVQPLNPNTVNLKQLNLELKNIWSSEYSKLTPRVDGVIDEIKEKFGFIKKTNNERIFFNIRDIKINEVNKVQKGLKVSFEETESFDNKKQVYSKKAIKIKCVN